MKKLRNKQGFTLIEVVVVMAIIAVLAVLVVGAITIARNTAKETAHRSNAKAVEAGLEAMYSRNKNYNAFAAGTCTAVAADTDVNVTLATGNVCANGGCSVAKGSVAGTDRAYTITISNAACADTSETIQGPVL